MVWTNLSFSFGAVLTSTQMNQLQENFTALADNALGAPDFHGRLVHIVGDNDVSQTTCPYSASTQVFESNSFTLATTQQIEFMAVVEMLVGYDTVGSNSTISDCDVKVKYDGITCATLDIEPILDGLGLVGTHELTLTCAGFSNGISGVNKTMTVEVNLGGDATYDFFEPTVRNVSLLATVHQLVV